MHQMSIIRQSERVKGDWWMSSPISQPPRAFPTIIPAPSKAACLSDEQHWTCCTRSVKRWGQDGADKRQLFMNRPI